MAKKLEAEATVESPSVKAEGLITRIKTTLAPIVKQAMALVIRNDKELEIAGGFLKVIKGFQEDVKNAITIPIVNSAHATHKAAKALENRAMEPLNEAESIVKPKIARYQREQEEIRQRAITAARLKAEQEAREKAELEKLERAQQLAEAGNMEAAAAVVDEEVEIRHISTASLGVKEVAKVAGVSVRRLWYAEVTDLMALVVAVAQGRVPLQAIEANLPFLNKQAQAFMDTSALNYPGVKVIDRDSVAAGR
jgi:hypothetical protein